MTASEARNIRREATRIGRIEAVLDALSTIERLQAQGMQARDIAPFFDCAPKWSRIMTHMEIALLSAA